MIGQLDLVFRGLDGCFNDLLGAKAGRVIITDIADPDRVRRLGVDGLRRYVGRRGVIMRRAKAEQIVTAARVALRLPTAERTALGRVLAADVALLARVEAQIRAAEAELADVIDATPAAVLTSLPGVAVVRASNYGAGIGDPARFATAAGPYRASGLVPTSYQSAGAADPASTSAGKDPFRCARPSSSPAAGWPASSPTSSPTGNDSSTTTSPPASRRSPSATERIVSRSPCCATRPPMTRRPGRRPWRRAGPPWRRPKRPTRTT